MKQHLLEKKNIPAAIHKSDKTARAQILEYHQNPELWELIYLFFKKTGVPALLNTSFNVNGEPIVSSPEDAIRTFYSCGLDILVMGNYIVQK